MNRGQVIHQALVFPTDESVLDVPHIQWLMHDRFQSLDFF